MVKKLPKVEIAAVGSELLTPYVQDTDSPYIVAQLLQLGLSPSFRTIVADEEEDLIAALQNSVSRADLLFVIGGLGPTEDDRTREILAQVLGKKLILDESVLRAIQKRFARRGLEMPPSNIKQAKIIEGAEVLINHQGTAPGQWLEEKGKIIVLLPGPPQELKPMFEKYVFPRLEKWRVSQVFQLKLKLTGITESQLEEKIKDLYPPPSPREEAREKVMSVEEKLKPRLQPYIFSTQGESLEEVVGLLLRQRHETLAVAESCTGGLLGHRLTNIPGSSEYFRLGIVAYSNEAKIKLLGVSPKSLANYGAVSEEVAQEMAQGIKQLAQTDHALAITGIAGPGGGTPAKPAGLVYTAWGGENESQVLRNQFLGSRELVKFQSSQKALEMLWRHLTQNFI